MLLDDVAATSSAVAALGSRTAKVERLAALLRQSGPQELPVVVGWLSGRPRQRRTGLGPAALRNAPPAADHPSLTVLDVDRTLQAAEGVSGPGASGRRRALLHDLMARATPDEQRLVAALVTGELRQGAAAGLLLEAVAAASGAAPARVRRALTLTGDLVEVATTALREGPDALAGAALEPGRPLAPMLASSAPSVAEALHRTGPAQVEHKLDGVRLQVHVTDGAVRAWTRTLDEVTARVPDLLAAVAALPVRSAVLDGELLLVGADGRPRPFQETASRVASRGGPGGRPRTGPGDDLRLVLFDLLHVDGADLVDASTGERRAALAALLDGAPPPIALVASHSVPDPADAAQVAAAEAFAADALAAGQEGVVVKALEASYAAGRRGAAWVKVKPRLTLDLVVLAAEWGHGRRTGWLSNLHLGARDPEGRFGPAGGHVMLGKTFKGLTDAMLAEQTERLLALEVSRTRWQVDVRPELVVEVAFDGVQTSPRYPAGVALRFARVLAHRPDKPAAQADEVGAVLALARG